MPIYKITYIDQNIIITETSMIEKSLEMMTEVQRETINTLETLETLEKEKGMIQRRIWTKMRDFKEVEREETGKKGISII